MRDATALTASVTGGTLGLPEKIYTLDAPLNDATQAHGWTQELRLSGGKAKDRFQWVVGGFYADSQARLPAEPPGQRVRRTCRTMAFRTAAERVRAEGQPVLVGHSTTSHQYAFFGEGTFAFTDRFSLTAGLRYYNYKEDKTQIFDGLFAPDASGTPCCRSRGPSRPTASRRASSRATSWATRRL